MKVLDNIGLGLFLFSIVSMVFWSPRPFSISHLLNDATNKISNNEQILVEKSKTIPFKTEFATKDTFDRMKISNENSKNLYRNSLTKKNEENEKPTQDEVSNWVGANEDSSKIQKHLNKPKEKAYKAEIVSKDIEKGDLDASYIISNDLKDTTYAQNIESYKQKITTFDQSNDLVVDYAREVFDKSNLVVTPENEIDKVIDITFQEMDVEKTLKFPNNGVSNIVESSKENVCQEDVNEENAHKKSKELDEQWNQMFEDLRFSLIEQSTKKGNNLGSTFVDDVQINEVKNEFNFPKDMHNSLNHQESIYDQNENFDEEPKKYHHEISTQQYNSFEDDYDDNTNYEGVKEKIVKYSHRTYENRAKIGKNDDYDYEASKYTQRARNHAHHHYRDARHKTSESFDPMKDATINFQKNDQYNEFDGEDDEDFYEAL